jgi:hypothetical protein
VQAAAGAHEDRQALGVRLGERRAARHEPGERVGREVLGDEGLALHLGGAEAEGVADLFQRGGVGLGVAEEQHARAVGAQLELAHVDHRAGGGAHLPAGAGVAGRRRWRRR